MSISIRLNPIGAGAQCACTQMAMAISLKKFQIIKKFFGFFFTVFWGDLERSGHIYAPCTQATF